MTRDRDLVERELGHLARDFTLKKPYRTKALAKRGKKATYSTNAGHLTAYRCHVCNLWHLGNKAAPGRDYQRRTDGLASA